MKYFSIIFAVLFLSACADKSQEHSYLVKKSEIRSYEGHLLSSILSHLEFIPLETRDDCLIGGIEVVKKRANRYYVKFQKALYIFDEKGKFLLKINDVGQGPGEYVGLCDFDADEEQVYLLAPNKLMFYGLDGRFRKEVAVDLSWGKIRRIKGGFLGYESKPVFDNRNGLLYMDDEGKVLKSAMPLNERTTAVVRWIAWPAYKEGCYIHQVSNSNDLYVFDANAKEFYTMRAIDDRKALSTDEYANKIKDGQAWFQIEEGIALEGFTSSASQLTWYTVEKGNSLVWVYDKEKKSASRFSWLELKDDVTFTDVPGLLYRNDSDDDNLVSYVDAGLLREIKPAKDSKFAAEYEKLKDMPEDSNPVLVLLKFK